MDEIFGYFPPTANPQSKTPLLTLLKQARAFGVGVVLATQNPVDLDYKGLANAGTWFIGRLQTDRDKQRVLDGLEGAAASAADQPPEKDQPEEQGGPREQEVEVRHGALFPRDGNREEAEAAGGHGQAQPEEGKNQQHRAPVRLDVSPAFARSIPFPV